MRATLRDLLPAARHIKNQKGMTLVEIMIVITIMAGVMGVVGFFVFGALDRANVRTAEMEITQLQGMVNTFYLSSTPQRLPNSLEELSEGPMPLVEQVPVDPWGNPYIYNRQSNREFEIYSAGPDGVEGTEDDVRIN